MVEATDAPEKPDCICLLIPIGISGSQLSLQRTHGMGYSSVNQANHHTSNEATSTRNEACMVTRCHLQFGYLQCSLGLPVIGEKHVPKETLH